MNEEPTDRLRARDDPQRADAARVAPTQRARVISGRFVLDPPGPPVSADRTCCGAGPYLLALAAQAVVLLQFNVHPSVGGPSGALSSALQIAPSQVWLAAYIALAALGVALYALRASRRMLIAWCVVIAIVALGASMGQGDWPPWIQITPEIDLVENRSDMRMRSRGLLRPVVGCCSGRRRAVVGGPDDGRGRRIRRLRLAASASGNVESSRPAGGMACRNAARRVGCEAGAACGQGKSRMAPRVRPHRFGVVRRVGGIALHG